MLDSQYARMYTVNVLIFFSASHGLQFAYTINIMHSRHTSCLIIGLYTTLKVTVKVGCSDYVFFWIFKIGDMAVDHLYFLEVHCLKLGEVFTFQKSQGP